jgi:nicotinamidase-related amidase
MPATQTIVSSPKRALIIIDVQNEYFSGAMFSSYPAPERVLNNIAMAMDVARAAGVPVMVVQHTAEPGAPIFQKGTSEWELHDVVKSRGHDHYVEKSMASIFVGTDVTSWLKQNEITTLSILGHMTQNCDASTIYQASHEGYQVEFLHDASGAVAYKNEAGSATAEEIHRVFSVVFHSNFAAVCSTLDWVDAVKNKLPLAASNVVVSSLNARSAGIQ